MYDTGRPRLSSLRVNSHSTTGEAALKVSRKCSASGMPRDAARRTTFSEASYGVHVAGDVTIGFRLTWKD